MHTTSDSPYVFLTQFDTIFLIDDSGSMAGPSWRETKDALAAITPICTAHDADGIDIYFFNHRNAAYMAKGGGYNNITTTGAVEEVFHIVRPLGGTPTGTRLHYVLQPYLERVEAQARLTASGATSEPVKPLNIIVITDGVPSDDVESVIVRAAKRLDACNAEPWQVGIQFFQVGNEPEAAEELRELDDGLASQEGVRRRVGGEGFEKAFVLGIRCDSFGLQPFPLFDHFDGGLGAEPSALSRPLEISQNVITADMPCEVRSPPI
jgi:uncharacterized protein YegL